MAPVNLTILTDAGYVLDDTRTSFGRDVRTYSIHMNGQVVEQAMDRAATAITALLAQNPRYVFVSPPNPPEILRQKVQSCPYLVINGDAVCLTSNKAPDDIDIDCVDNMFSLDVIKHVVLCTQRHPFEKAHIESWREQRGNQCPYGHPVHDLGPNPMQVDDYQQTRIQRIFETFSQQKEKNLKNEEAIVAQTNNLALAKISVAALAATQRPTRTVELVEDGVKIAVKGTALALKGAAKIPLVSLVVGVIAAACRICKAPKDKESYLAALFELASGFAACFPGVGTLVSIGFDSALMARDAWVNKYGKGKILIESKQNAEDHLGLPNLPLSKKHQKEDIDKAFRQAAFLTHTDRLGDLRDNAKAVEELNKLTDAVNKSKEYLYKLYGY